MIKACGTLKILFILFGSNTPKLAAFSKVDRLLRRRSGRLRRSRPTTFRIRRLLAAGIFISTVLASSTYSSESDIDRKDLVSRHNPNLSEVETLSPFTLGNGAFAFTADLTGMQTFTEEYASTGIPLSIQSEWGWHSLPNPNGYKIEDAYVMVDTQGREVPYPIKQSSPAGQFGRSNPHRIGLANIGFRILDENGDKVELEQITDIDQELDLFNGLLRSRFTIDGTPVSVITACHPELDSISVQIESSLVSEGKLHIEVRYPYGSPGWGLQAEDWSKPGLHTSKIMSSSSTGADILHELDETTYRTALRFAKSAKIAEYQKHHYLVTPESGGADYFEFTAHFHQTGDDKTDSTPFFSDTADAAMEYWHSFWHSGGAIDLSGSSDPRANELERRIVLSQYLTAVQCGGRLPPQETGLTANSWYGKPHLEMHWWHGVHFALWNRLSFLEDTLPWYQEIMPKAEAIATVQGYPGVRWPKNVDKDGNQVASSISPLLLWQQPHPIYYAELCYRAHPDQETLERYSEIVFRTAEFMAAFPHLNEDTGKLDLGPPVIPAQESHVYHSTSNPPFELAYWRWGIETAQKWLERQDKPRNPEWDAVLENLAPIPVYEDMYATAQGVWNPKDHPIVVGIKGMLPGNEDIDDERLETTLRYVLETYDWEHTWGWDYPMMAMTAARLGEPELAIEALMLEVQKNTYLNNGHNYQDDRLRLYMPGNGGLLIAVAMMAAGWDDATDTHAPGFPQDGTWQVKWENLSLMP